MSEGGSIRERALHALREGDFRLAEQALAEGSASFAELAEELRIHQAELEIQNQQLREAETEAERQSQRFATLFLALPVAALAVDEHGIILEVNDAACALLQLQRRHLQKHFFHRVVAGEHETLLARYLAQARQDGKAHAEALRFRGGEDDTFSGELHVTRLDGDNGGYEYLCVILDLSEQLRQQEIIRNLARQQIEASEDYARLLLESSGEGIFGMDGEGNCLFCNPAALEMLGFTELAEIIGKPIHALIHHSRPDGSPYPQGECPNRRTYLEGREFHVDDEVFWRTDGTPIAVEYRSHPIRHNGRISGVVVTFSDITLRREFEHALHLANETLEARVVEEVAKNRDKDHLLLMQAKSAAIGEMIQSISHQWRQPLNVLALILTNLRDSWRLGELSDEEIETQYRSGNQILDRMSRIIDQFRSFFQDSEEKRPFSASGVIRDATFMGEAQLRSIHIDLDDAEDLILHGHPSHLLQVILSLLANAAEAIRRNGVAQGSIGITLGHRDRLAAIVIRDNGGGIPADIAEHLFTPYFTTKANGSGMGLYMAKMVMERMLDGAIEYRALPNGSEFTLYCPISEYPAEI